MVLSFPFYVPPTTTPAMPIQAMSGNTSVSLFQEDNQPGQGATLVGPWMISP